jgi:hypothetical protein
MLNNSPGRGTSWLVPLRLHDEDPSSLPGTIKPQPRLERTENDLENILRWEDDGGKITEPDIAVP